MLAKHGLRDFVLPDEWWFEAGMSGFRPQRSFFRAQTTRLPTIEVRISDVEPCWRELSHGIFNDDPAEGTARQRVVRILRAFRDDVPLPPVDVVRADAASGHLFRLHHGAHRFYCAIAAGFEAVPATDVTDELAKI